MKHASIAAACLLLAASPAFAATAANSQNGTQSSNPNATLSPPTSTSAVPATNMPMGEVAPDGTATSGVTTPDTAPAAGGTGTAK